MCTRAMRASGVIALFGWVRMECLQKSTFTCMDTRITAVVVVLVIMMGHGGGDGGVREPWACAEERWDGVVRFWKQCNRTGSTEKTGRLQVRAREQRVEVSTVEDCLR